MKRDRMHRVRSEAGEGSQGSLVAIVLLVIALIAVFFLWMNDRQSQDAELDIDIGLEDETIGLEDGIRLPALVVEPRRS